MNELQASFAFDSVTGRIGEELNRLTNAFRASLEHHLPISAEGHPEFQRIAAEMTDIPICALDHEVWPCRTIKGALAALTA